MTYIIGKLGKEGHFLNMMKGLYLKKKKNSVNIIHSSARLKESPLKSVLIQRSPFSPISFNIILEILARTIRQEK